MAHALVVFTKVPAEGVKTRLTVEEGGILEKEEAVNLYRSCLKDVLLACEKGITQWNKERENKIDLLLCYRHEDDLAVLLSFLDEVNLEVDVSVFADKGQSFDQRMQSASDEAFKRGYDSCLISGGDLPTFSPDFVKESFSVLEKLNSEKGALVTAACQEGGFSLVGFTQNTPFNFEGVFYNREGITAMDMLVDKVEEKTIPLGVLPLLMDIDLPVDLASLIPLVRALYLAHQSDQSVWFPRHFLFFLEEVGLSSMAYPPQEGRS